MIDVIKLAESASPFGKDSRLYFLAEVTPEVLNSFAALVLEEAEKAAIRQIGLSPQSYHTATVCITAIRALKPQE
jgi:hypothetical protein